MATHLATLDIATVWDLRGADPGYLRRRFPVVLERTVRELRGISCLPLELAPQPRHTMMHSRHFGRPVTGIGELREVAAIYAAAISGKLRRHGLQARGMTVFLSTSPHTTNGIPHNPHRYIGFTAPTCSPPDLIGTAITAATAIANPDARYIRAGILLTDLSAAGSTPPLWGSTDDPLATAVDRIGERFGRDLIGYGRCGIRTSPQWDMRQDMLSPAWTTRWSELPIAQTLGSISRGSNVNFSTRVRASPVKRLGAQS